MRWTHPVILNKVLNVAVTAPASACLPRRGLIMGVWNSHTSVGNILGSLIAGVFVSSAWGLSFIVPGIIIGVMGVICFFFLVESEFLKQALLLFNVSCPSVSNPEPHIVFRTKSLLSVPGS